MNLELSPSEAKTKNSYLSNYSSKNSTNGFDIIPTTAKKLFKLELEQIANNEMIPYGITLYKVHSSKRKS